MLTQGIALQRRGTSNYSNGALPAGSTTIVAGGANVNGVVVRTISMSAPANSITDLTDGASAGYFATPTAGNAFYNGPGLIFPPGVAVVVRSTLVNGTAFITYDLL